MATDRSIVVRLKAVVSEYKQGMSEAAQATRQVGDTATKASQDSAKGFGAAANSVGGLSTMLKGASVAFAAAGIGAFVAKSVASFSQLEDATAAATVVFGNGMSSIVAQANGAATALGMAKSQVIDAAITFGTFGKSAGLAGSDLAKFSTDMTQLAGDMASFRGTTPEQAIEAIGAALRGESEPIRAYGVLIDDASTKQQALKMHLIETTTQALTPQQRVLAVQAQILQQTSDAQGDFARTADSTANVQKRLTAEWENAQATLGGKLAPYITAAQKGALGLLEAFERNSAVLTPLIQLVGGLALGIGGLVVALKVADVVMTFNTGVQSMQAKISEFALSIQTQGGVATAGMMRLGNVVSGLGSALPVIGIAAAAAGAAFLYFGAQAEQSRQHVAELTNAIREDSGAIGENTRAYVAKKLSDADALAAANRLGISLSTVTDAALGNADAIAEVKRVTDQATNNYQDASAAAQNRAIDADTVAKAVGVENRAVQEGIEKSKDLTAATTASASATATQAGSAADAAKALQSQASAAKSAADEIQKETAALWGQIDATLAASGSTRGLYAAADAAAESFKKNGKTLSNNTEAGRANADALEKIVAATESAIQANAKNGAGAADLNKILGEGHDAFVKTATSILGSAKAAEDLWATYKLNPGVVETLVKQNGAQAAQREVANFLELLASTPPEKRAQVISEFNATGTAEAKAALAAITDKNVTVTLQIAYNQLQQQILAAKRAAQNQGIINSANGNILHFYSNGGFENHAPRIFRDGVTRIFNEPETGGESYIPLGLSKRAQAIPIWKQTGHELGIFADGGFSGRMTPAVQRWNPPNVNVSPSVGVQVLLDGRELRHEMRVTYSEQSAVMSTAQRRNSK